MDEQHETALSKEQLELCYAAWLAHQVGGLIDVKPEYFPEAHDLAERGWLKRVFTDDGAMGWGWSATAEAAFRIHDLLATHAGQLN